MKFKSTIAPLALGILIASPSASFANYDYTVNGSEANWVWNIDTSITDGINDLVIDDLNGERINRDLFDRFGVYKVDGNTFDTSSSNGDIVGGQIEFLGDNGATEGGKVTWTFSNNNWHSVLTSSSSAPLEITGNLGSDSRTKWLTQGSYLLSYENNFFYDDETEILTELNNGPYSDPIILWESDGEIITDGEDSRVDNDDGVSITKTGTSLTLTVFAYAHRNDGSLDTASYFNLFESFVKENKYRTDIFTPSYVAKKPAPANVRQTSNLTFAQSLYASDKLSDPDGQLRATLDQIMNKYGSLIN